MKNTRGLSTVVTSLIIILLVLVAIGIVWVVVSGMLKSTGTQIDISSKCVTSLLSVESATCASAVNCTVGVKRTGGYSLNGTKVVFSNSVGTSTQFDIVGDPGVLKSMNLNPGTTGVPTKVSVVGYFNDADTGVAQTCSQSAEKTI